MKRIIYTLLGVMLTATAWAQTLQEQINSAEAGATVTLTENVTIDQTVLINKSITINGAGHTITSSVKNNLGAFYVNVPTSDFTITNAVLDGNGTGAMAVCAYRGEAKGDLSGNVSVVNNNSGNHITLTDCTVKNFTGYPNSYVGAVYAFSTSTFNLNNCTFTGNTTSKSTNGASGADVWAGAAATVNISGGSYGEVFVNSNAGDHASITVSNDATVKELAVCVTEKGAGETNQPVITIDNASVTDIATETGNILPSSAVTTKNGGTVTNVPTSYVAQIGDKKYSRLADAVVAATAGLTVTLLSDVNIAIVNALTINKQITLDLAGHTVTSNVEQPIYVGSTGDLTITGNGTISGPTGAEGAARDGKAIISVEGGKLTYLNGTLTCGGAESDGMYGVYILNGGTAIFGEEAGKTGPTITSWFAAIGENNTTAPAIITVYGGSYTAQASPTESDWWSYYCAPIYAAGSGEINISGGAFNGYYGLSSRYSNVDQDLNITGGTFTGTKSALFFDTKSGVPSSKTRDVAVSGGSFSSEVAEEYCADGFIPKDNGDGTFGVKEGSYKAQIAEKKYENITEALAAATASQTITLLADAEIATINDWKTGVTLDKNGHELTVTNFTVTDGVAATIPFDFTATTATYTRTMPAGTKWGTVCVPFTLTQGDDTSAPKLYTFGNINGATLTVNEVVTSVAPGTPVVFSFTGTAVFTTSNATVSPTAPSATEGLVGTYSSKRIETSLETSLESIYYINGNAFHQAKASLTVPAYRAYIDLSGSLGAKPSVLSLFVDDDMNATYVGAVMEDMATAKNICDILGRQFSAPKKGINIMKLADGKIVKVIIK